MAKFKALPSVPNAHMPSWQHADDTCVYAVNQKKRVYALLTVNSTY
ncbi:MAG: hypothetical protein UR69_C0001G0175 [Candidatus Moranbacteria bacterium GW2011_GWE2_35_2-]|nr:MAG: hypothetical protein UR69_C0001G0175 [Candidatus Moranbacteria bacterium GW2011_GWE2_35_2-]KKQ06240.1 MAG: hypothetical protein US15_C0015G0005 [Candidatus Moranbacteria bacterium GW2011_GWF1_36_4]KKQ22827.1 MAG: hypothetical protein US37_C0001G0099 [Candidatus Moranbacteria bacterium GW2011_GWF2_37_11]KKQ30942.1 MAG: hypothetical protein US47_C0001G0175 [Candidatus Moranbacteria bacterium GW2011_GWE1_37_24]KKQ47707.1 MAG: hypothetical protein US66_C0007G0038 [Candidatus Moranbacteria b